WIELEFVAHPGGRLLSRMRVLRGFSVLITPFGSDGWSRADEVGWLSAAPPGGKTLDQFLAEVVGIPHAEADQIATESVDQWNRRSAGSD
ncbi:MAG TPA: hypothetical protein VNH45_06660, partial [Gaiellaceae bacterium]|nr:hypothetical protein [Gaiellaceae bacterium]